MSLFAVLNAGDKFRPVWHFWFFVLALHSLLAVMLIRNRIQNTHPEDFDPKLRELIYKTYRSWLKKDAAGATAGMIMSGAFGVLTLLLWSKTQYGDWVMAFLPGIPLFIILYFTQKATRQLQELDRLISKEVQTPNETA